MKAYWWILGLLIIGGLMPGYAADTTAVTVSEGVLGPCLIKLAVPAKWNGQLLLIAHGMRGDKEPLSADFSTETLLFKTLLQDGWLIASTSYRRNGYIIDDALEDIDLLRKHVIATYGQPKRILLVGGSMGGDIVVLLAERHPDQYAGALSEGAALVFAPKKYTFAPSVPILFLCTPDEIADKRDYIAKAKATPLCPVLWYVKREGHCRFNDQEELAAFRGLLSFADSGKCNTEKDITVEVPPPPSTAIFADGAAKANISKIYANSGSLDTALVKADFDKLGIKRGTRFNLTCQQTTVSVLYGVSYSDVPTGDWIAFVMTDGYVRIARNWANANEVLKGKVGDAFTIAAPPATQP
ncbi:MAG TPA: SAM hydroxide adenosyltransferase [Armatimonadota bacterium]|jgi:pimeloyl-ACP methyl ester carboxylesterase